ncbi:MAG TPA: L-threonylcarbamoyladenylate synthase [Candidatus Dormibacteraeota bacterium]|nr:L-threonylcarbamoyladenylate synthase [Candidatus Dormibacteraeota bacterium]
MTDRLPATPEGIAAAAEILRAGGLVAFPTDTVYGVGCAASHPDRLAAIFELKRRPTDRRIPMLVTDLGQLPDQEWSVDDRARALAGRFWPGALTIVLASASGGESQAFRAPDHSVAQALIQASGPLLATSANISGEPDTLDADDVLIAFATQRDGLDAVIDGGRVPGGVASTVVDLSVAPALLLRDGPVAREELAAFVELGR